MFFFLCYFVSFQGVVQVGAVDMDNQANQQLGGQYGIRGFPTIKVIFLAGKICSSLSCYNFTV